MPVCFCVAMLTGISRGSFGGASSVYRCFFKIRVFYLVCTFIPVAERWPIWIWLFAARFYSVAMFAADIGFCWFRTSWFGACGCFLIPFMVCGRRSFCFGVPGGCVCTAFALAGVKDCPCFLASCYLGYLFGISYALFIIGGRGIVPVPKL